MREKVRRYFADFNKAVNNLEEAIERVQDDLDVDGAIKRFELCYELFWKLIKVYLEDQGIICKSPRDCFKQAVKLGLIDDEKAVMEMIDDRNFLVHTYSFDESRYLFEKIKNIYFGIFKKLHQKIKEEETL